MQKLTTIALAILLLASCQKEEKPIPTPERTTLTDFLYLPTKDAVWKIHLQGEIMTDNPWCGIPYAYDTAVHQYYTIESTGLDTFMFGHKYYKYNVAKEITYSKPQCKFDRRETEVAYYREDTLSQRIYKYGGSYGGISYIDGVVGEDLIVDFSTEEPGQEAEVSSLWPSSCIGELNGVIVNGQNAKMWEVVYRHDKSAKFFYKAYGLGNQAGLLPNGILRYTEPKSLEFTYKGKTNHFEFDVHPSNRQYYIIW